MNLKRLAPGLALVLVLMGFSVSGQAPGTGTEDYESYTPGVDVPGDTTFATVTNYQGCAGPCVETTQPARFIIETPGFGGSGQKFQLRTSGATDRFSTLYNLNSAPTAGWDYLAFYADSIPDGESFIEFCGNNRLNTWVGSCNDGTQLGDMFRIHFLDTGEGGWDIENECGYDQGTPYDAEDGAIFIEIYFDYAADDAEIYMEGVLTNTVPFCDNISYLSSYWLKSNDRGAGDARLWTDEWLIADLSEIVVPLAPDGLRGIVGKTGGLASTGYLDLYFPLSASDPDQVDGSLTYHIYRDGVKFAIDTVDEDDGVGVRNWRYYYTGSATFGSHVWTVTAEDDLWEGDPSCSVTLDQDVAGDADACGSPVVLPGLEPSEFDVGLEGTIAEFGFVSKESQMLFSMLMIGMVTVATGAITKWLAPSKWKNWTIVGAGITVAVMCVILGFLDLWIAVVATMLGVFAVRGGGEARNTFYEIRERLRAERAGEHPTSQEMVFEGSTDLDEAAEVPEEKTPEPESVAAVKESIELVHDGGGED